MSSGAIPGKRQHASALPMAVVLVGRLKVVLAALAIFALSAGIRLHQIDLYSTTDEAYWIQRTLRFGAALWRGDLSSTYRAGHPGVSVMWVGLLGVGPDRLQAFLSDRFVRIEVLEREPGYLEAFGAARRAAAVGTAALVTLAVLLAWRLLGPGPGLAGGAILLLDPYVIGMTRLLHVDALLAPLMTVSALGGLLALYGGLSVRSRWRYVALSGISGGLALLTKAPAGFLIVFLMLAAVRAAWRASAANRRHGAVGVAGWAALAGGTYVALFPALWVDPLGRAVQLIQFVQEIGLQPHDGNFFLGAPVLDDPGPLYYLVAAPLRVSPLVILGLATLALPRGSWEAGHGMRWLSLYAVLFVALMTLASKKFDRYLLPAFMVLDLLAGVGLWRLAMLVAGILPKLGSPRVIATALAGIVTAAQLGLLISVWPYPIAYYNPLAGGPERARSLIMIGWGEGLEQVAAYLNGVPDSERARVVSSYNHVLRPRFRGTTRALAPYLEPPDQAGVLAAPEYVVLYVSSVQRRQIPAALLRTEEIGPPVFVATVNGMSYAWVYRIPPAERTPGELLPDIDDVDGQEN